MSRCSFLLPLALLPLLLSCSAPGSGPAVDTDTSGEPLPVELLQNRLRCGADLGQPAVRWIDDGATLASRYQAIASTNGSDLQPPAIDFSRTGVLLITMGREPTTGYRLNFLKTDGARLRDGLLRVRLVWQRPPPDAREARVDTQPCLLLRVPAREFEQIRVIDQNGAVRLSTGRNASRAAGS